jgi:SAM-dependent methyltransferase
MARVIDLERDAPSGYADADAGHFRWATGAPYVAEREAELVRAAFGPLEGPVLDVGCGEGATFLHLGPPPGSIGVDLFADKIAFANAHAAGPGVRFVQGSAYELPVEAGAFRHVILRDVIHHLPEPARALREVKRVLAPGGRFDVLEPCRTNPLVFLHALSTPTERGELRSTPRYLERLLGDAQFRVERTDRYQPMPLHRLVLHPSFGRPALGAQSFVRRALDRFEGAARVLPARAWFYVRVRARA